MKISLHFLTLYKLHFKIYFIEEAIKEAEKALINQLVPIGCICVQNNVIVGRGSNGISAIHHAEMVAMTQFDVSIPFEVFVTVEPCIMCTAALMQTACSKVTFCCFNEKFGGCGGVCKVQPELPWKQFEIVQVDNPEAIDLLKRFFSIENTKIAKM